MTLQADRLGYLHGLQARVYGSDFEALPHQTPPDGDWFFWLLEAGRGAGKTAHEFSSPGIIWKHTRCSGSSTPRGRVRWR